MYIKINKILTKIIFIKRKKVCINHNFYNLILLLSQMKNIFNNGSKSFFTENCRKVVR